MKHLAYAAAAVLAGAVFYAPPAQAQYYGDAPWCAVVNTGTGEVFWDCEFATVEQCVPNVLAGNRGFCNLNPYYVGPPVRRVYRKRPRRHG